MNSRGLVDKGPNGTLKLHLSGLSSRPNFDAWSLGNANPAATAHRSNCSRHAAIRTFLNTEPTSRRCPTSAGSLSRRNFPPTVNVRSVARLPRPLLSEPAVGRDHPNEVTQAHVGSVLTDKSVTPIAPMPRAVSAGNPDNRIRIGAQRRLMHYTPHFIGVAR